VSRERVGGSADPEVTAGTGEKEKPTTQRMRGGSSYQHSLSARGIKSSGRARSCSETDLLSSMERLERATRLPTDESEESRSSGRTYGRRHRGSGASFGGSSGERLEERLRGPRFEW